MSNSLLVYQLIGGGIAGFLVNWLADILPSYRSGTGQVNMDLETVGTAKRFGSFFLERISEQWRRWLLVVFVTIALVLYAGRVYSIRYGEIGSHLLEYLLLCFCLALFWLVLIIDVEHRRVLNIILFPVLTFGLAHALLQSAAAFVSALLGGGFGFLLFLAIASIRSGAMGAGDVKLAGTIGVLVGFPNVIVALCVGILAGGIGALALLITRRTTLHGTLAYAPYLAIGAWAVLLHGSDLILWYTQHFTLR